MFKENKEGQTHSFNDGCGEPEHNMEIKNMDKEAAKNELSIIKKIYIDLMKIADDNELEDMRREIIRYFQKND